MSAPKIIGYKVRNTKTGLYLSSLSRRTWTKCGKTWSRRADVFRTIRAVHSGMDLDTDRSSYFDDISNWELIELVEASSVPIIFHMDKLVK